jgi:hypothetical protein
MELQIYNPQNEKRDKQLKGKKCINFRNHKDNAFMELAENNDNNIHRASLVLANAEGR